MASDVETFRFGDQKPSETFNCHWIAAEDKTGSHEGKSSGGGPGKWMIFPHASDLDREWEIIKTATETGQLGSSAKVSTAYHMQCYPGADGRGLICVYTEDCDDKADVMRVREALRELGFTQKLSYKSDAATLAGIYRSNGHRNFCMYRS